MVKLVSSNTQAQLPKEAHLILQDWLYSVWPTVADIDYPGLPLRYECAFGYHWADRQRAGKNITIRTRSDPEIVRKYLTPLIQDYNIRVWVDYYVRVIDTTFDGTIPQLPSSKLSVMRNFIRDIVETSPQVLQAQGIHSIEYERFDQIPNDIESNVEHGIVFVRLVYRLVGI